MKTYNAQIEKVKDHLNNISGLAIDYDCLSGEEDMKGLIDSMADWAREALAILEKLPRDSRGQEGNPVCPWGFSNLPCPAHGCVYCPFKDGAKNNADNL